VSRGTRKEKTEKGEERKKNAREENWRMYATGFRGGTWMAAQSMGRGPEGSRREKKKRNTNGPR